MAESFDAVLAEIKKYAADEAQCFNAAVPLWAVRPDKLIAWHDRLQAAHEREVGELRNESARRIGEVQRQQAERLNERCRADAAVVLLRECQPYVSSMAQASHLTDGFRPKPANEHDELAARLTAFLSEQAGERENGDG